MTWVLACLAIVIGLRVVRALDGNSTAWLAPVPYDRAQSWKHNVGTWLIDRGYDVRGVSWRVPFTHRWGYLIKTPTGWGWKR